MRNSSILLTPVLQIFSGISILTLVAALIGLFILWIIVSIPVYFAAKIIVGLRAHFGSAMLATLVGPVVFAVIYAIGYIVARSVFPGLGILALLAAFLAWIWVYKAVFHTGWLHAFAIAVLAVVIAIVLLALLAFLGFVFHAFTHVFRLDILQFALPIE